MIQAEQLHKGNKLKFEDEIVTVLWITPDGVIIDGIDASDGSNITLEPERLDYIPLDEEWLKRLNIRESNGCWTMPWCGITAIWKKPYLLFRQVRDIAYVHDLQNLYYSLTGQELEIKQDA